MQNENDKYKYQLSKYYENNVINENYINNENSLIKSGNNNKLTFNTGGLNNISYDNNLSKIANKK